MSTVVWVPYRASKERDRIFKRVLPRIKALGYPVVIADSGHRPFSIANTWNLCAAESGDWTRAIRWGADFAIQDPESVHLAVAASKDFPHVKAFERATKLTMAETKAWLGGEPVHLHESALPFGGPSVITREAFETVSGYDPRFVGWGHEDRAFIHSLHILCGPTMSVPGRMIMLRHPGRAHLPDDPYYANQAKNLAMWREYEAITDPAELHAHIASVRSR